MKQPAALSSRSFAIAAALFPTLLALFFWPTLQSAFLLPKTALLVVGSALLFVAAAYTGAAFPRGETRHERGFLQSTGALLLIALLSAAFSDRKELAPHALLFLAAGPVLMVATAVLLRNCSGWLIRGVAAANLAVALIVVANRFGFDVFQPFGLQANYPGGRMQIAATLGNPNFVASFLAASAPALLFISLRRAHSAWLWRAALVLSFVAVWLTQSRLGIAAFAVAIITPLFLRADRRWLALALVAVFVIAAAFINRHNPRQLSTADAGRRILWRASFYEGAHLVGNGPGTFAYHYPSALGLWFFFHYDPTALPFTDAQTHAHNDFIECVDETGSASAILLIYLLAYGLIALFRKRHTCEHASYAFAGMVAILLTALFDFPLHRAEMWALLWLWFSFIFLHEPLLSQAPNRSLLPIAIIAVPVACVSILPAFASYHVHEGLAFEAQSSDREAAAEYQRALRFDRTSPDANFYLARALANAGDPLSAFQQTQIAERWVDEPELFELRARILSEMGENERALETVKNARYRFPYARNLVATELELSPAQK